MDRVKLIAGWNRVGVLAVCLIAVLAMTATTASAIKPKPKSKPKLTLTINGQPAPVKGEPLTIATTELEGPEVTCTGDDGFLELESNKASNLKFKFNDFEGKGRGFVCDAQEERELEEHEEPEALIKPLITITASTVTETFQAKSQGKGHKRVPTVRIEAERTECTWLLTKLSGPRPSSGSLEGIHIDGTLALDKESPFNVAATCPETSSIEGTLSLEPGEASPSGKYLVEEIG
jgi:hypothetical protein